MLQVGVWKVMVFHRVRFPMINGLTTVTSHCHLYDFAKQLRCQHRVSIQRTNYWSCCENSGTNARNLNFSNGNRGNNSKSSESNKYRVRPVTALHRGVGGKCRYGKVRGYIGSTS